MQVSFEVAYYFASESTHSVGIMSHTIRDNTKILAFKNFFFVVATKWVEGCLAIFPVITLDSILNQKTVQDTVFGKIQKEYDSTTCKVFS